MHYLGKVGHALGSFITLGLVCSVGVHVKHMGMFQEEHNLIGLHSHIQPGVLRVVYPGTFRYHNHPGPRLPTYLVDRPFCSAILILPQTSHPRRL